MKYMGSKSRIVKDIVPIIQKYIDGNNIDKYCEPFCGGCNVIDKIVCKEKYAYDLNPYLIALLKHVSSEYSLYESVPKDLYDSARNAYHNKDDSHFKDWEIGNIGFLASYNGRFFDGGYAKPGYEKTKSGERYRDYYQESKSNLLKQAYDLKDIIFGCKDYKELDLNGYVIYCDPPYNNTKKFANASSFDYEQFWDIMRKWSKDNIVIISELEAPNDFECIWEKSVSRSIKSTDKSKANEKLFIIKE